MKQSSFKSTIKTLSGRAITGFATVVQSNDTQFIIIAETLKDLEKYGINHFSIEGVKKVVVFEDREENICESCMEEK